MSTHNLCFGSKVMKIGTLLHTPVLLYKVGYKGVYVTRKCYADGDEINCNRITIGISLVRLEML